MEKVIVYNAPYLEDSRVCYDFERKIYSVMIGRNNHRDEAEAACREWIRRMTGKDCYFVEAGKD